MKLEEIRKLCEAATPGPWTVTRTEEENQVIVSPTGSRMAGCHYCYDFRSKEDDHFIAASRTLLPRLLAVAEAAQLLVRRLPFDMDCLAGQWKADVEEELASLESDTP